MPYRLIKGKFQLSYQGERHVGSRPDGDSMWFEPNNEAHLADLEGRSVKFNGGGFAQLRFEGIDALELHYRGSNHQKAPECVDARDYLLQSAGFTDVTYAPSEDIDTSVRTYSPDSISGYILTRNADPYGRPVAFVFTGAASGNSGSDVWLSESLTASSLNAGLIGTGNAYPAYYTGLPSDLGNRLTQLAASARQSKLGVWKTDKSKTGVKVTREEDLEKYAIWPKLYRRMFSYFKDGGTGLAGFETWLRADADRDDELWIISRGELGNMHDIFTVQQNKIKMVVSPEDIIVVPG